MIHVLHFAARRLVRRPTFFALTAGSLAVALGVTTAAFGFADAWLHPSLAFEAPERTATVIMWGGGDVAHGGMDARERWQSMEHAPSIERFAFEYPRSGAIEVGGDTFRDGYFDVSTGYFGVVGVRPRLGRAFLPGPADDDAVVVSDYFWRRYFGNRPEIGDASLAIGGRAYRIVGVAPRGVRGSFVTSDIWHRTPEPAEPSAWTMIRFKPGVPPEAIRAEFDAIAAVANAHNAFPDRPYGFGVHTIADEAGARLDGMHLIMMLVAGFILAIACANVSALMLARAAARRRDLALRLSLGATHGALVADVMAELVIVTVVGLAVGLAVAYASTGVVRSLIPPELTWTAFVEMSWSWRVFAEAGAALGFVVVAAGALPALQVARIPPIDPLKESSAGSTARAPRRMKSVVMLQLAISLVMLIATSVVVTAVARLSAFDFGFNPRAVIATTGNFVYRWNTDKLVGKAPTEFIVSRVTTVPGVTSVSYYNAGRPDGFQITSDDIARDAVPLLAEQYTIAGPRFMATSGIPIIEGRDFAPGDEAGDGAVILDDSAAKALFPTSSAVGHRVRLGRFASNEPWRPVIGVARSIAVRFPATNIPANWPAVYVAMPQPPERTFAVLARVDRPENVPMALLRIRREVESVLPLSVQLNIGTLSAGHDDALRTQEQMARLFGTLSLGALLFASAGLFAVLSYMVSQRMREFGIRVAIGAQQRDVARLVLRDALELALGGTAIGGSAGIALAATVGSRLFDVDAAGAMALVSAELVLIGVTMLASLGPVLRATRANPVDVLRTV